MTAALLTLGIIAGWFALTFLGLALVSVNKRDERNANQAEREQARRIARGLAEWRRGPR